MECACGETISAEAEEQGQDCCEECSWGEWADMQNELEWEDAQD